MVSWRFRTRVVHVELTIRWPSVKESEKHHGLFMLSHGVSQLPSLPTTERDNAIFLPDICSVSGSSPRIDPSMIASPPPIRYHLS